MSRKKQAKSPFDINDLSNKREIGSQPGTLWSLSSQKPGHGVRQLRDPDLEKLWQSDGTQPHRIIIEFAKRTAVTHISLWLNVIRDDSYTPTKILVEAGTDYHDLTEVRCREWEGDQQPVLWKHFYLSAADPRTPLSEEEGDDADPDLVDSLSAGSMVRPAPGDPLVPIHTWLVQISILANHQNGKDTHVRGCLIWGPRDDGEPVAASSLDRPPGAPAVSESMDELRTDLSEAAEPEAAAAAPEPPVGSIGSDTRATRTQRLLRTLR